ncbi:MAG: inositol monophosphatase family protein [Candidatus Lernaella stagnicola]|nr:inositol monophosphatase family protein [Candidatus Lernaella stagnicola]
MKTLELSELAAAVERIARQAGRIAMDLRDHLKTERKDDGSAVTQADVAVEDFLFENLSPLVPDAVFLGEERPVPETRSNLPVWVVDPIDGTDAYRQGLAYFGVCVGLAIGCEVVLGVFHNPFLDETYVAWQGGGAYLNGRRISVGTDKQWQRDCFVYGPSNTHLRYRLDMPVKLRSLGSTAEHMVLVADGRACFTFCRGHVWDVAAAVIVVREAGGVVRHFDGRNFCAADHFDGKVITPPLLAGNEEIVGGLIGKIEWLG